MAPTIVNPGLMEFFQENAKTLTADMPWMRDRTFKCCASVAELADFVDKAIAVGVCALDTETTGLNTRMKNGKPCDRLVGLSMSYDPSYGLYIPVGHIEGSEQNLPLVPVLDQVRRLCTGAVTVYHHAKFDLAMLRNHGMIVAHQVSDYDKIEDTQILTRLYDAGRKETGLKSASEDFLKQKMIEFSDVCGGNGNKRIDLVDPSTVAVYAASDAVCTLDLFRFYMTQKHVLDQKAIYNLEKRTIFVVMQMESNMFKVDVPYLEALKKTAEVQVAEITRDIHKLVGKEFNIGSSQQLGKILFEELRYTYPDKGRTATGKWSTDTSTLEKMKGDYPVVEKIIKYRELEKSLGTYISNLLNNHDSDGFVKVGFNQTGTDTGRFSSPGGKGLEEDGYCGVNIQSLPSNYDPGTPDVRKSFVARPGFKIVAMDYSGEELRVAANLSREPAWVESFLNNEDLHRKTAQLIYGRQEVTKLERGSGKTLNFAILYGAGPRRIAEQAKCSEPEAKKMLASFRTALPTLNRWIDTAIKKARKEKRVCTSFGRIRPLAAYYDSGDKGMEMHGDRCVANTQIQGCLQGHERCLTTDGYLPILDIMNRKKLGKNIKIWTGTSWENFDVLDRGPADLAEMELDNGMRLDTDTRHEVLIVGEKGYEFKSYIDLKEGDRICVSMPTEKEFGKYPEKCVISGNVWNARTITVETPEQWDFIAYLMGYITGDGSTYEDKIKSKYTIGLSFGKEKLNKNFKKIQDGLKSIGANITEPRRSTGSAGEAYVATIPSIAVFKLLSLMKYKHLTARFKRIPQSIFEAPLSMRKAFFQGYFDTDGANVANCHSFHTPNRELLQDTQLLAWTLGCPSRIHENNDSTFILCWTDLWKVSEVLGIERPARRRRPNTEKTPLPAFHKGEVLRLLSETGCRKNRKDSAYLYKIEKGQNVNLTGVLSLLEDYGKTLPGVYYHSPLKRKKEIGTRANTFTLSVHSPLHRFDSAGIISKNTSADIMKTAMVRIHSWIFSKGHQDNVRMLLTMHDEIVFEIKEDMLVYYIPRLNQIMKLENVLQDVFKWPVPLVVDAEYGDSWHTDKDFFEEHPELKSASFDDVGFVSQNQASGRYAIAIKNAEAPAPVSDSTSVTSVPIPQETPVVAPSPIEQPVSTDAVAEPPKEVITPSAAPEAVSEGVLPVEEPSTPTEPGTAFVYTLRNRNKSTMRLVNVILLFLHDEGMSRVPYASPRRPLVLKDPDGNSLLVSQTDVCPDAFLAIARFVGI